MFMRWKIKRLMKKIKLMQANRLTNQPSDEQLKKEIACYLELGAIYKSRVGHKKYPQAQLRYEECLRAAAGLDDAQANYLLGKIILDEAKLRDQLEQEGVFKNTMNAKKCQVLYEEAHAYLSAAINIGHVEAKRLRGLCLINGWGIESDRTGGFKLIVDSIEQEGSWDRVPQIFASIGLNKPEFFAAIVQHRKQ